MVSNSPQGDYFFGLHLYRLLLKKEIFSDGGWEIYYSGLPSHMAPYTSFPSVNY